MPSLAKKYTWTLALCALALTGCVSREEADAKLARGCAAAAELFLEDGYKIKEIKGKTFGDDSELGRGFRHVVLQAVESDGWDDSDQEYKCIFTEANGFLGMGYTASIYQLKMHDETYGKEGDKLLGSYEDHLKLMETVDKALN